MDRQARVAASLDAVHEALRLVRRELAGADGDPARWRWVAVGAVIALQGALVAALSGYETAGDADVADPALPDRVAPIPTLLRRARSSDYLNPPEQLEITASGVRRLERLVAWRNAVVHGGEVGDIKGEVGVGCEEVVRVVRRLLLVHPAFNVSGQGVMCALIADEVAGIERWLAGRG
ncbi:hypothetical protein [Hyphomonas johnsonii]|uniref:RiboL-PSP-HEPN domain-containing protein n=1 Tax=Hyphomonas johnsonii MHS-2 TaxID=1280950 RepID=A0A059FLR9_9PROT|nr:hypothetical protein [Hyphomonas johnsonii]KCZ91584.1 hypothetical protein HJO_10722 [Hyphomonas johnsonii MHS-2]